MSRFMHHKFIKLIMAIVVVSLLGGCSVSMTPSVSKKDLEFSSQIRKYPLNVVVAFPKKIQDATYAPPEGSMGASVQIGKSSVELFKEGLPALFQNIEFMTEDFTPGNSQIIVIPEITEASCDFSELKSPCKIEYDLSFFNSDNKRIFKTYASGNGQLNGLKAGVLGGLTFFAGAPGLPLAAELAKTFRDAQIQAMNQLIDKIASSPELLTYAGSTKLVSGGHYPEKRGQQSVGPRYPPKLICKVSFKEPSGNYILDAGEEGALIVTIENKGKGDANLINVDIGLMEQIQGLSYNKHLFIKTIPTGGNVQEKIPLWADSKVDTSHVKFKVQATAALSGVASDPVMAVFQTRKFQMVDLNAVVDNKKLAAENLSTTYGIRDSSSISSKVLTANADKTKAKQKLAVMELESIGGVSDTLVEVMTNTLKDELHASGEFSIISREEIESLANRLALQQQTGACTTTDCLADMGKALGTKLMVYGSISKVGSTYSISLRLLDTESKEAVRRVNERCKCDEEDLFDKIHLAAAKLMRN